jgi:hypothetical protein
MQNKQALDKARGPPPPPPPGLLTGSLQPAPPPPPPDLPARVEMRTTEQECLLGGFTSGNLKPIGLGAGARIGGCGVYATSRRIVVIKSRKGYWGLVGALGGIAPTIAAARGTRADISPIAMAELDQDKYFEARKEDISRIEVKKPHFSVGYLNIVLNSGGVFKVVIGVSKDFELTKSLMQIFCPERLIVVS